MKVNVVMLQTDFWVQEGRSGGNSWVAVWQHTISLAAKLEVQAGETANFDRPTCHGQSHRGDLTCKITCWLAAAVTSVSLLHWTYGRMSLTDQGPLSGTHSIIDPHDAVSLGQQTPGQAGTLGHITDAKMRP